MPFKDPTKRKVNQRERNERYRSKTGVRESRNEKKRLAYWQDPEKYRQAALTYYWEHRDVQNEKAKQRQTVTLYGLSRELLDAKWPNCCICGLAQTECPRRLHVDHCHTTKAIRGRLCPACNTGLGGFKDDVGLLRRAIAYIERCHV